MFGFAYVASEQVLVDMGQYLAVYNVVPGLQGKAACRSSPRANSDSLTVSTKEGGPTAHVGIRAGREALLLGVVVWQVRLAS